jgi:outer membrane protein assembly factor BamB
MRTASRSYQARIELLIVALVLGVASAAAAQQQPLAEFPGLNADTDWPWWRGPSRNGIAADTPVPTTLGEQNLRWKAPVPGRGHSSPTVVGNRVFLTTADNAQQVHYVLAFDRTTGKPLWQTEINRGAFPTKNHSKNTEATPTVACDGQRVFASFYHHDQVEVVALDLDGKIVWKKTAGYFRPRMFEYGYAPSPLVYRNAVIVSGEFDGESFLVAFERSSGRQLWRTPRPTMITFSSPVVGHVAGKDQLFLSGADKISAYDPASGKPLWSAPGTTLATCGTLVWDGDIVVASGGFPKAETLAVRADGSGTVLWKNNQKCYEQSLLAHQGYVYALTDGGILYCWRVADGQQMWLKRLKGPVSASPVLAGGHIYWANELGTLYVFRPNPQSFELVAENQPGSDSFASPAICGGQIFLRIGQGQGQDRQEFLHCYALGQ